MTFRLTRSMPSVGSVAWDRGRVAGVGQVIWSAGAFPAARRARFGPAGASDALLAAAHPVPTASCRPIGLRFTNAAAQLACRVAFLVPM